MRNTKIVCTIGPVSESKDNLRKLIEAGMNVARMNFSHGDFEEHGDRIKNVRQLNKEMGTNVAILLDTKGPEIRTNNFKDGKAQLETGDIVRVSMEEVEGNKERFSITYEGLINDVAKGSTILIDDGLIGLEVIDVEEKDIVCKVQNSGLVKNKKGINVPNVKLNMDFVSTKDRADIEFGCDNDVDFIAASFVRRKEDVLEIKEILKSKGKEDILIISKIENQEGVDNLDEIIDVSDGIMVARGDLGVEIDFELVPIVQKTIIKKCNNKGKIVVTATHLLDSMQHNPRPTRAEVSDVVNAVLDGSDAIMLSGETAAGKYPSESVATMSRIAQHAEKQLDYSSILRKRIRTSQNSTNSAIAISVAQSVLDLNASVVVAATVSGFTARSISRVRPRVPILAVTPSEKVVRTLALNWGVHPVYVDFYENTDELIEKSKNIAIDTFNLQKHDKFIITGGLPTGMSRNTNFMKIEEV